MSDHPSSESLAMYALDAHDPTADGTIAAHVLRCSTCRDELAILRESAALLAESVPPLTPPPALRERVLASATATPRLVTESPALPRRGADRTWPVLAAASLLITAVTGAALLRIDAERQALRTELSRVESLAAERDTLLSRLLAPDMEIATLVAAGTDPSLRLYRDRARGAIVLAAHRLPPAPTGQTYQLWGIGASGEPTGLGTFNTAADGSVVVVLAVDAGLQFDVSAVTREPAGGSRAPTTTPFLVGRWGD